jgi:hypothetical protein
MAGRNGKRIGDYTLRPYTGLLGAGVRTAGGV